MFTFLQYQEDVMKHLTQIIGVLILVFFGCSKDYPTGADVQNIPPNIDEQASLAKKDHFDLLTVFRTERSPVIDGRQDKSWRGVPRIKISNLFDVTGPLDGPRDLSAYFQMMWDDDNLYLFVEVTDNELNVASPNSWENDGIQIYFDGDNSKNTASECTDDWGAYDSNDYQLTAAFGQDPISYPTPIDVAALHFAYEQQRKGYTIEAALPFDVLLFTATKGHRFGFEMQVNDNDLGVLQNVLLWSSTASECTYLNPSLWGTAILADEHGDD
jgi:hypothetical protein